MAVFEDFGGTFRGLLRQVDSRSIPDLLEPVLNRSSIGNLQGLVDRLEVGGFADRVWNWANSGQPEPISAVEVRSALKAEEVGQLSRTLGMPDDSTLSLLADNLPAAVDAAAHNGNVVVHGNVMLTKQAG